MNWIEQLTGLSPVGGSGSFELFWLTVPVLLAAGLFAMVRSRRS